MFHNLCDDIKLLRQVKNSNTSRFMIIINLLNARQIIKILYGKKE